MKATTAPSPSDRSHIQVIALFALSGLLIVSELYVTLPMTVAFAQEFGASASEAVWAASTFSLAYAAGNLFFGPLSDRFGRLPFIRTGAWVLAALTALLGWSPTFTLLLALRLLQGFTAASFPPVALAYLGETLPPRLRATGIAFLTSSFLIAGIVGQVLSDFLTRTSGWSSVFFVLSATYVVLALTFLRLPPAPPRAGGAPTLGQVFRRMVRMAMHPPLAQLYLVAFTLLLSFVAFYAGFIPQLARLHELSGTDLLWVRLAALPGLLLTPLAGPLIGRYGATRGATFSLLLAAAALLSMTLHHALPGLVVASAVFVMGIGFAVPAVITLVGTLGAQARGAATAVYAAVVFLGASAGPLLARVLEPFGFTVLAGALALTLSVAAVLAGVRPRGEAIMT